MSINAQLAKNDHEAHASRLPLIGIYVAVETACRSFDAHFGCVKNVIEQRDMIPPGDGYAHHLLRKRIAKSNLINFKS